MRRDTLIHMFGILLQILKYMIVYDVRKHNV